MHRPLISVLFCIHFVLALMLPHSVSADPVPMEPPAVSRIHFRPAHGVLGDTIPFYWKGTYHIFYLKGQRWGHIASRDLVHWNELPEALDKGEKETDPDFENCWTGSLVAHKGLFHLFYTGKNSRDPKGDQKVMQAISKDLITWTKQPEYTFYADGVQYWSKPVNGAIDDKLIYHHQAFRDPEVFWNAPKHCWGMLLHATRADGSSPVFAQYVSDDLCQWKPFEPLLILPVKYSGDCPNIFQAGRKWYVIAADRHYTAADALEGPYRPEMLPYEAGELFVPKTMFDGRRRLLAGWIGDRQDGKDAGNGVWGGTMSMVRELYPDAQGRLGQRPPREIIRAYRKTVLRRPKELPIGESVPVPGNFMAHFRITPTTSETEAVLSFRVPPGDPEAGYRLRFTFGKQVITLGDRFRTYTQQYEGDPLQPVEVRLFVEDTVTECFINNAYCFTMRTFDARNGALRLDVGKGNIALDAFTVKTLE